MAFLRASEIDKLSWGEAQDGLKCCVTTAHRYQVSGSEIDLTVHILSLRDQPTWVSYNEDVSVIWKTSCDTMKLGMKLVASTSQDCQSMKLDKGKAVSFQVKAPPCSELPPGEYKLTLSCRPLFQFASKKTGLFVKEDSPNELRSNVFSLSVSAPKNTLRASRETISSPFVERARFILNSSKTSPLIPMSLSSSSSPSFFGYGY